MMYCRKRFAPSAEKVMTLITPNVLTVAITIQANDYSPALAGL
jgi:hypothetical protein